MAEVEEDVNFCSFGKGEEGLVGAQTKTPTFASRFPALFPFVLTPPLLNNPPRRLRGRGVYRKCDRQSAAEGGPEAGRRAAVPGVSMRPRCVSNEKKK